MTVSEFEAFVSENYEELKRMARTVSAFSGLDFLHSMVEAVCDGRAKPPPFQIDSVRGVGIFWKYLVNDRSSAKVARKSSQSAARRFVEEHQALGDDVYTDTVKMNKAKRARRSKVKLRGDSGTPSPVPLAGDWIRGQVGDTRFIYQKKRDEALYDTQAVQSLGEHIRGRSSRSLHGAGRSLVLQGAEINLSREDPRWWQGVKMPLGHIQRSKAAGAGNLDSLWTWASSDPDADMGGDLGWTFVSCSTGYQFHGKKRTGQDSAGPFERCSGCSEYAISGRHDGGCIQRSVWDGKGDWPKDSVVVVTPEAFIHSLHAAKAARAARKRKRAA